MTSKEDVPVMTALHVGPNGHAYHDKHRRFAHYGRQRKNVHHDRQVYPKVTRRHTHHDRQRRYAFLDRQRRHVRHDRHVRKAQGGMLSIIMTGKGDIPFLKGKEDMPIMTGKGCMPIMICMSAGTKEACLS